VPEDAVAQNELAALTRRYEEAAQKNDREFGIVKSDLTALRLQVGNLDQKVESLSVQVVGLDERLERIDEKIDRHQAQIVELLTRLVGKDPDAA
jgi:peptidoglycan hydrolase CwlO-like protein